MREKDPNYKFCRSYFTSREVLSTAGAAVVNAGIAYITFGLTAVTGAMSDPKYFHKDEFLKIVKENHLDLYRKKILSIRQAADEYNKKIAVIYDNALKKYLDNISNIKVVYEYKDQSGMTDDEIRKSMQFPVRVVSDAPERKRFDFQKLTHFDAPGSEADNVLANLENEVKSRYEQESAGYRKYVEENFNAYALAAPKKIDYRYNDYVSYRVRLKFPEKVNYIPGKKIKVGVYAVIEYADLQRMIPQKFTLEDEKFKAVFYANPDLFITAVGSNKTKSFLTIQSLTSYYGGKVYTISNVNREIAPEATTLTSNSRYALFSPEMKALTAYYKVTRAKAEGIRINYGYAVKYRIMDSNLERTIYDTKDTTLYHIFKTYL